MNWSPIQHQDSDNGKLFEQIDAVRRLVEAPGEINTSDMRRLMFAVLP